MHVGCSAAAGIAAVRLFLWLVVSPCPSLTLPSRFTLQAQRFFMQEVAVFRSLPAATTSKVRAVCGVRAQSRGSC